MKKPPLINSILAIFVAHLILPTTSIAQGYTVPGTELARPRSLVDHGRTDRLTGDPNPAQNPTYCPSGQVYSGGTCVLISNQGTPSWTSYFVGQTKCKTHLVTSCASINGDGTITFQLAATRTPQPPLENSEVTSTTQGGDCNTYGHYFAARPEFTNAAIFAGGRPTGWQHEFRYGAGSLGPGGCNN